MKKCSETKKERKFVLVTTQHKGVFAGWLVSQESDKVTLSDARCALYWSSDVGGFLGLAEIGPTAKCKISAKCQQVTLSNVTSVSICTEQAADAWQLARVQGR